MYGLFTLQNSVLQRKTLAVMSKQYNANSQVRFNKKAYVARAFSEDIKQLLTTN